MGHSDHEPSEPSPGWPLPVTISFIVLLGITAFFLIGEQRVHLGGILPCLLILLIPSTHLFMHGGHGGHNHDNKRDGNDSVNPLSTNNNCTRGNITYAT